MVYGGVGNGLEFGIFKFARGRGGVGVGVVFRGVGSEILSFAGNFEFSHLQGVAYLGVGSGLLTKPRPTPTDIKTSGAQTNSQLLQRACDRH